MTEIQVSASALRHNVIALRSLISPGVELVAVVKGNAYGHGLTEVVPVLEPLVDAFQVDDLTELRALRGVSTKRTLVLGYVPVADVPEAVALGGEYAIYDRERLQALAATGGVKVHLKVDALLGRQGVIPADLDSMISSLREYDQIEVVAAYAHFANIEDTTDLGHAQEQLAVFDTCFARLRETYPEIKRHVSATSGAMTIEAGNDFVRIGIGIYGMYPSASLERGHAALDLWPVMRWRTGLAQVKVLPARHPVGYGLTYVTPRETRVGIVPQGYADGYDRGLSNVGAVLVGGTRCPVLGRVAMNMFAIDLSEAPEARVEDEVVLLGDQGGDRITAEEIALQLGTINYEITTRVSPLLPRRVVT